MYNFERAISNNEFELTLNEQFQIYNRYLKNVEVGKPIKSPFREDRNPSFALFLSRKSGNLMFKDFSTGLSGDVVKFIMNIERCNYKEAIEYIKYKKPITNNINLSYIPKSKEIKFGIVRQPFTQKDIEYWSGFHISMSTLKHFNVFSIKYLLINDLVKYKYSYSEPMYAYKIQNKFKIYRPLSDKKDKWRTNTSENDIQGYQQLPEKGNTLIITKSLKDVMVLYELGISAISPNSEGTLIPSHIINDLNERFKNIYILYDNDEAGINASKILSDTIGKKRIFLNEEKDISDYIKRFGLNQTKKMIYEKIEIIK